MTMSAKLATVGLLKIKAFWWVGYDVIISAHDATIRILSRDSNHIVNVVTWPKFGNSSITMKEVIITSSYHNFISIWPEKAIFWGLLLVQVEWFGNDTWYGLEILRNWDKGIKTRSQNVFVANSYVCRSYMEKNW